MFNLIAYLQKLDFDDGQNKCQQINGSRMWTIRTKDVFDKLGTTSTFSLKVYVNISICLQIGAIIGEAREKYILKSVQL